MYQCIIPTSFVGPIGIRITSHGVYAVTILSDGNFPENVRSCDERMQQCLLHTQEYILAYLAGSSAALSLQFDTTGLTPFMRRVYACVGMIPYGKTASYGEVARMMGMPLCARAVGQALAKNRFAIIIPCHRVVSASARGLGGYTPGSGLETKRLLLQHEQKSPQ